MRADEACPANREGGASRSRACARRWTPSVASVAESKLRAKLREGGAAPTADVAKAGRGGRAFPGDLRSPAGRTLGPQWGTGKCGSRIGYGGAWLPNGPRRSVPVRMAEACAPERGRRSVVVGPRSGRSALRPAAAEGPAPGPGAFDLHADPPQPMLKARAVARIGALKERAHDRLGRAEVPRLVLEVLRDLDARAEIARSPEPPPKPYDFAAGPGALPEKRIAPRREHPFARGGTSQRARCAPRAPTTSRATSPPGRSELPRGGAG